MTDKQSPLILVVDDYQDEREMYAEYLQFSGFRVAEARNGNEAIEQAFALRPYLILMDLSLPGMDGWEATRRLRDDPANRAVRILALTAHAMRGDRERALAIGCDDVVTKPYRPVELIDAIERASKLNGTSYPPDRES